MAIKVKNAILSAFFGAVGPFLNKQATLDESRSVYKFFQQREVAWAIWPFNITCIVLMLVVNTIAVKYKMLSYKYDGAFLGTSLIFVLGYLFSAVFDYIYEGDIMTVKQTIGAFMMIFGIMLITKQEDEVKIKKHTNSFYKLIPEDKGGIPDTPLTESDHSRRLECLIDKTKTPVDYLTTPEKTEEPSTSLGKSDPLTKEVSTFTESSRPASRQIPGAMGAIDFIHMRKGFL